MDREGVFAPETAADARQRYAALAPAAEEMLRAATREMGFDAAEYDERVTDAARDTARDALFASLLEVSVGTREEYEAWREEYAGEVVEAGSENVDNVAWHAGPDGRAVAATFHEEREAAAATLRRQAFGEIYADLVDEGDG
jgi:hypothetical protein